jgi:hypothetical protein
MSADPFDSTLRVSIWGGLGMPHTGEPFIPLLCPAHGLTQYHCCCSPTTTVLNRPATTARFPRKQRTCVVALCPRLRNNLLKRSDVLSGRASQSLKMEALRNTGGDPLGASHHPSSPIEQSYADVPDAPISPIPVATVGHPYLIDGGLHGRVCALDSDFRVEFPILCRSAAIPRLLPGKIPR